MRSFHSGPHLLLCAALLLLRSGAGAQTGPARSSARSASPPPSLPFFETNGSFVDGLEHSFDPGDIMGVFAALFRNLPRRVFIRPTENYYYFSFLSRGRMYRGNFRLSAADRDRGLLDFIYYEYQDEPQDSGEAPTWFAPLGRAQGVRVRKVSARAYAVEYSGKKVIFYLPAVPQTPPHGLLLGERERFVERIRDESGYFFLLLFDEGRNAFRWLLDESAHPAPRLDSLRETLMIDRLSGFVFLIDARNPGKTLVGVASRNVQRNTYWDGPFDQLAENERIPRLREFLERAYPYARGKLDSRGNFLEEFGGGRLAITPYVEYSSLEALVERYVRCRETGNENALPCLAHDEKCELESGEP